MISGVKHIVAVASGKGGVGKSTVAVNLALALLAEGVKTGILDADIYGPSQGLMLGVADGQRPDVVDEKWLKPVMAHGLQTMSMSYMVTEKTPMVWRGPMASGALQQLLLQTQWTNLEYLIVDMPPGTGDIQLTLSQKVPVTGAVVVTTPQDIALLDAFKAIEMFAKVDVPILGVVENMSFHICEQCGHRSDLFGSDGGSKLASDHNIPLMAAIPLDRSIRAHLDSGVPTLMAEPDGEISNLYRQAAKTLIAQVASLPTAPQPEIRIED